MKAIARSLVLLMVAGCLVGCSQPAVTQTQPTTTAPTTVPPTTEATVPVETTQPDDGLEPVWHLSEATRMDGDTALYTSQYVYDYAPDGDLRGYNRTVDGETNVRWEYVWDDGHIIEETAWYGTSATEERRNYITYDEAGRVTSVSMHDNYELLDEVWYEYADGARPVRAVWYSNLEYVGREDYHDHTVTYTYDDLGNCLRANSTEYGKGRAYAYTWDEAGRLLTETCERGGMFYYTLALTYDGEGRVTQRQLERTDAVKGPTHIRECYTYDENGNLSARQVWYGDVLQEDYRYSYTQLRLPPERAPQAEQFQKAFLEADSVLFMILQRP